jgi:hypothetical protein
MAAKKNPTRKPVDPKKKDTGSAAGKAAGKAVKPSSAADFRKKEEEDKRIARETKRNPKDANGNSYFGPDKKGATPKPADPYKPNWDVPEGTPWKPDSPYNPKNDPKKSPNVIIPKLPAPTPSKPKTPDAPKKSPSSTTTTNPPSIATAMKSSTRGMNSKGKIVLNKKKK